MDPFTMMLIGGSALADFSTKSAQANLDEAKYQKNRIAAAQARDLKIQSLNARMLQEGEAAAAQKEQMAIATLKQEERAKVAAGEAGVAGQGVDALVDQFENARLKGVTTVNAQTKALRNQIEMEKMGITAEAVNRINSLPRGQQPNFLAHAIKAGAQMYGTNTSLKPDLTGLDSNLPSVSSGGKYFGRQDNTIFLGE